jgi:hypothetical protein
MAHDPNQLAKLIVDLATEEIEEKRRRRRCEGADCASARRAEIPRKAPGSR